jgi:hypothetical protein
MQQLGAMGDDPQVRAMLGDPEQLNRLFYWLVYGTLIVGTILAQGAAAWYYGSRVKYVRAYLKETPKWVVDLQKAQAE